MGRGRHRAKHLLLLGGRNGHGRVYRVLTKQSHADEELHVSRRKAPLNSITPSGGGEFVGFNHPDKLSTRLVTNTSGSYERAHLLFGTALNAESTGSTNRRFTGYEQSGSTGLDYAVIALMTDSLAGLLKSIRSTLEHLTLIFRKA